MPTPSSGPISFQQLQAAFGTNSPVSINNLYRGGIYVPNIPVDNAIPTSGTISLNEFYNAWGRKSISFTMTVGSHSTGTKKKKGGGSLFGAGRLSDGTTFGSISAPTFLTPSGVVNVVGMYFDTGSSSWTLQLSSASTPPDSYMAFSTVAVSGYTVNTTVLNRTSSTTQSGSTRNWHWTGHGTSHPISGTVSCTLHYYG